VGEWWKKWESGFAVANSKDRMDVPELLAFWKTIAGGQEEEH
jgi:hypothetical protein